MCFRLSKYGVLVWLPVFFFLQKSDFLGGFGLNEFIFVDDRFYWIKKLLLIYIMIIFF